jgi:Anti-sigma-K factor rskA, C-terminal
MTESTMTEDLDRDDRAVLTAMARLLASGAGVPVPRAAAEADETLIREYLEALGLLPYGLEPESPSPAIKERILARIAERPLAGAGVRDFDEVTFAGFAADPLDVTLHGRGETAAGPRELGEPEWPPSVAAPPAGTIPFPRQRKTASAAPPRRSRWNAALAAALVLCVAGLAYLADKVTEQNRTIARLTTELEGIPIADFATLYADLKAMEHRFDMVTTVAREAYHLQGVERVSDRPVEGVVYVCGNHQRWYLNVQGLESPPAGQEYRLWFLTGDGMIDGGAVHVEDGARAELEATTMPKGTQGFAVTLEDMGSDHRSPGGVMVLLGEESVSL